MSAGAGIFPAVLFSASIFGSNDSISKVTSVIVRVIALVYILRALSVTVLNIEELPAIFSFIIGNAFDFQSITGDFDGSCVMLGIKRGLFSSEAGIGSAPDAAAAASVSHPARRGLIQSLSVYIDTLILCTCSALMVMVFYVQDPALATSLNAFLWCRWRLATCLVKRALPS